MSRFGVKPLAHCANGNYSQRTCMFKDWGTCKNNDCRRYCRDRISLHDLYEYRFEFHLSNETRHGNPGFLHNNNKIYYFHIILILNNTHLWWCLWKGNDLYFKSITYWWLWSLSMNLRFCGIPKSNKIMVCRLTWQK